MVRVCPACRTQFSKYTKTGFCPECDRPSRSGEKRGVILQRMIQSPKFLGVVRAGIK